MQNAVGTNSAEIFSDKTFFKNLIDNSFTLCYYIMRGEKPRFALLAQLDRVTDYESVGQGFESLAAHHKKALTFAVGAFLFLQIILCLTKAFVAVIINLLQLNI